MAESKPYSKARNAIVDGNLVVDVAQSWEPLIFLVSKDEGVTYSDVTATSETIEEGIKRWRIPCVNGDYIKLIRGGTGPEINCKLTTKSEYYEDTQTNKGGG